MKSAYRIGLALTLLAVGWLIIRAADYTSAGGFTFNGSSVGPISGTTTNRAVVRESGTSFTTNISWSAFSQSVTNQAGYLEVTNAITAPIYAGTNHFTGASNVFDGDVYLGGTKLTAGASGTTNMMVSTITYGTTISPTFAISGLSTTAASARRVTFRCTLTGDITTVSAPAGTLIDGDTMVWEMIQDGTGSRLISGWDAKYAFGTDITGITLSTGINKRDFITFIYNSTADKWYCVGFVRGY